MSKEKVVREVKNCPVCGQDHGKKVFTLNDAGYFTTKCDKEIEDNMLKNGRTRVSLALKDVKKREQNEVNKTPQTKVKEIKQELRNLFKDVLQIKIKDEGLKKVKRKLNMPTLTKKQARVLNTEELLTENSIDNLLKRLFQLGILKEEVINCIRDTQDKKLAKTMNIMLDAIDGAEYVSVRGKETSIPRIYVWQGNYIVNRYDVRGKNIDYVNIKSMTNKEPNRKDIFEAIEIMEEKFKDEFNPEREV